MELRQLEYFIAVVEEGTFTRGAARVRVAQPGVSAQIGHLERELGLRLLDRSGRTVHPTEAGQAVLPYARAAMAAVAGVRSAADAVTGLLRGRLRIGTVTSISSEQLELTDLLARFHEDHPGIQITLAVGNTDALLAAVRDGSHDLAFVGLGPAEPEGVEVRVLTSAPIVAAVGPGHPLAARRRIRLAELAGHPLVSLPAGTGLRACLDETCIKAGIRPEVAFEAADPRTLIALAERGLGVALVPDTVAAAASEGVRVLRIQSPGMTARLALAWRSGTPPSPAARELIRRTQAPAPW